MFGSSVTPRYGVNITATNHDIISANPTTQKMLPAYSPAEDAAKPIGAFNASVTNPLARSCFAYMNLESVAICGGGGPF